MASLVELESFEVIWMCFTKLNFHMHLNTLSFLMCNNINEFVYLRQIYT
jgi:hypothetical protein